MSSKILSFWEKEFNASLKNHMKFLHNNIEDQEKYDFAPADIPINNYLLEHDI